MTTYIEKATLQVRFEATELLSTAASFLRHLYSSQRLRKQLARERQQLKRLPVYLLDDIGVDQAMAKVEANSHSVPKQRL